MKSLFKKHIFRFQTLLTESHFGFFKIKMTPIFLQLPHSYLSHLVINEERFFVIVGPCMNLYTQLPGLSIWFTIVILIMQILSSMCFFGYEREVFDLFYFSVLMICVGGHWEIRQIKIGSCNWDTFWLSKPS